MSKQLTPPPTIERCQLIIKPDQNPILITARPKLYYLKDEEERVTYIPQLELSFFNESGNADYVPPGAFFELIAEYCREDLFAKVPIEIRLAEGISGSDWTLSSTAFDDATGLARAWYSDVGLGTTQDVRIVCRESIALPDSAAAPDEEEHLHFSVAASCAADVDIDAHDLLKPDGPATRYRLPVGVSFAHDPWLKVKRKTIRCEG